ncbi:L-type lectin-domain containing receptor kinase S-4 [Nymphaea thermarum]|nr:L-type lectin-domain containing receptor kinase S-4 [Nymphaea thermarum]
MDLLHQLLIIVLLLVHQAAASAIDSGFTFNGFQGANLTLDGSASITPNGLLRLNVDAHNLSMGHAFYPSPFRLKNHSSSSSRSAAVNGSTVVSFSILFAFTIKTQVPGTGGHGFAIAFSPSPGIPGGRGANYLGLFNQTNMANSSNHIFSVEFDTAQDVPFGDINDNHVGVDMNTLTSTVSAPAAYFISGNATPQAVNLQSGSIILAWIDYQSDVQQLNVTIAPIKNSATKPEEPLLSTKLNLSSVLEDFMYIGFSSGSGKLSSEHYIHGWSFGIDGVQAQPLDLSKLPSIPTPNSRIRLSIILAYSFGVAAVLISLLFSTCYIIYKRRNKLADIMEGWELEYPHRFSYRELYAATRGFREKELLGSGGFGSVYKGVLPGTREQVAVKRVSHNAKQGLREFVAEVASLGRLRHRNLVHLQGWCRRREELLLVYEFMPNGSLDSFLFDDSNARNLGWEERFNILKGIASGLLYLHEGWEQVVVHRDVKASNVLLDGEMNGRLGDFGLARLYEHGKNPQTTRVVGTLGYMAPELSRTGKAAASADVFSFGALLLEVACGRRPIEMWGSEEDEEMVLIERVLRNWQSGDILSSMDSRLEGRFVREEAEVVLKLGVMCSQAVPDMRPTMRQVVQYLNGDAVIPRDLGLNSVVVHDDLGFEQLVLPYPVSEVPSFNSTFSQRWSPII